MQAREDAAIGKWLQAKIKKVGRSQESGPLVGDDTRLAT
jgi:hypothetical protein